MPLSRDPKQRRSWAFIPSQSKGTKFWSPWFLLCPSAGSVTGLCPSVSLSWQCHRSVSLGVPVLAVSQDCVPQFPTPGSVTGLCPRPGSVTDPCALGCTKFSSSLSLAWGSHPEPNLQLHPEPPALDGSPAGATGPVAPSRKELPRAIISPSTELPAVPVAPVLQLGFTPQQPPFHPAPSLSFVLTRDDLISDQFQLFSTVI